MDRVDLGIRFIRNSLLVLFGAALLTSCASRPVPYASEVFATNAETNFALVSVEQEQVVEVIDLYQAMARALKYNLDYQVAATEAKLENTKLNLAHYSMLPDVAAKAGYAARNNELASNSMNLLTNTLNFGSSTSQEQKIKSGELAFSWNILDFGLSYIRAGQAGDKVLISEELKRKVTHKLLEDVRSAYWRAVSYERLYKRVKRIKARTQRAYVNTRTLSNSGETSRVNALISERELLDIKRAIGYLQRDMITAKAELAALIGLKPGINFKLATNAPRKLPKKPPFSLDDMMMTALRDRAELRQNLYQKRINQHEAKAVLLEMLPGLQLYAGPNYNSNTFLTNNDWVSWGANASWNLLKVFQYPAKKRMVAAKAELLDKRALALSMAVMTQVHIARIRYSQLDREWVEAKEYRSVQNRLVRQYRQEAKASRVSEKDLLREEMNTLVAEAKYDIANSELQRAYASLFATIGWDPYVEFDSGQSVKEIAAMLKDSWTNIGKF